MCTNKKAFTLTELLAVITIIALVAAIAVIGFVQWHHGKQLETTVRDIAQTAYLARSKSVTMNEQYGLDVDVSGKRYRLYKHEAGKDIENMKTVGNWKTLPASLSFDHTGGHALITFNPSGSAYDFQEIRIYDQSSRRIGIVAVEYMTGRVTSHIEPSE